ncbi:MAG: DUF1013 domain-containing protein [Rhodospirillaceae bacterium]|jgi:uncharacterized protein|nr:DUF1013 domain-containing protein [Rhodospirillaceae bacterium]MBT5664800.1 DUF1013 domain-containing protein [Rhodospirillaceae bacterium]MBT5809671.1 DUF1013 domain-containing protein [Rhodospirillaceae bacterium]
MARLLMPKGTAVWLVDNTTMSFLQVAEFCGLHELEVQAIADDEVAIGIVGQDPITGGQLTREEIERCERDPAGRLELAKSDIPQPVVRPKGPRYTPVSKRADKPDAIAWLLRNQPDLTDAQIGRLIGTTKPTITAVRDRTHWNSSNLTPRSPVEVGLCTHQELRAVVVKAAEKAAKNRPAGQPPESPAPLEAPVADTPVDNSPAEESAQEASMQESLLGDGAPIEKPPEPTVEDLWPSATPNSDAS